jgi:hypothetical protein
MSTCLARCPSQAPGLAIIMPAANRVAMAEQVNEIAAPIALGARAVLVCDGASQHQIGKWREIPDNITRLSLPPSSTEWTPTESVGTTNAATTQATEWGTSLAPWSGPVPRRCLMGDT